MEFRQLCRVDHWFHAVAGDRSRHQFLSGMARFASQALVGVICLQALAGCGGGSSSVGGNNTPLPLSAPPPLPQDPDQSWLGGYYGGTAYDASGESHVRALLLHNGHIRMQIGEEWESSGSVQFIGKVLTDGDHGSAEGALIGQGCASSGPSRFCGTATTALLDLNEPLSSLEPGQRPLIEGTLTFAIDGVAETWYLDLKLGSRNGKSSSENALKYVSGIYSDFYFDNDDLSAFGNDVVISADSLGGVFFQSAGSGCAANGNLAPYPAGSGNTFLVSLDVEGCTGGRAYLNGAFGGLAVNLGGDDAFGRLVVLFLSRADAMHEPVAVTMWWLTY